MKSPADEEFGFVPKTLLVGVENDCAGTVSAAAMSVSKSNKQAVGNLKWELGLAFCARTKSAGEVDIEVPPDQGGKIDSILWAQDLLLELLRSE